MARRTSICGGPGFEANQYSNNATGQPRPGGFVDQYGFELDGPAYIPKVYRGKERTFFMFSMEKYRDFQPQPAIGSVPTAEQRSRRFFADPHHRRQSRTPCTIR